MNHIHHPPVPPSTPAKTRLYNLIYNGNVERRNLPAKMAHAIKRQLISKGTHTENKFKIEPV